MSQSSQNQQKYEELPVVSSRNWHAKISPIIFGADAIHHEM